MSMQVQCLRPTRPGNGIISIKHIKLGGKVSVIEATISQDSQDKIQGYFTRVNFAHQSGLSLATTLMSTGLNPPPPTIDFAAVARDGEDANWRTVSRLPTLGPVNLRKASQHAVFTYPKETQHHSFRDQWMRFRPGGHGNPTMPGTQEALGYVVDMFPMILHDYPDIKPEEKKPQWYPVVAMNLDFKRRISPEAGDWLFLRTRASEVRNGRMDYQIVVKDMEGNLIALWSIIYLILDLPQGKSRRSRDRGNSDAAKEMEKL